MPSDQVKAIYTMLFPLIAAINLLLASFGIKPFEDSKLNAMVMVASVMLVLIGFIYNHFKHIPTTTVTKTIEVTPTLSATSLETKQEQAAPAPLTETPKASNAPPMTAVEVQKALDQTTSGSVTAKDPTII